MCVNQERRYTPLAAVGVEGILLAVPEVALVAPAAGDLRPGRETLLLGGTLLEGTLLVGVDLAEELVESFEGDLSPVLLEADETELLGEAGAVVGLFREEARRNRK